LIKIVPVKDRFAVEEVWFKTQALLPWHDGIILVGDHVYVGAGASGLLCLELATGKGAWQERGGGGGGGVVGGGGGGASPWSQKGEAALVEATPKAFTLKGRLKLSDAIAKPGATAPVIAAGRLYLRDDNNLFCYEIKEGAKVDPKKDADVKPEAKKSGDGAAR